MSLFIHCRTKKVPLHITQPSRLLSPNESTVTVSSESPCIFLSIELSLVGADHGKTRGLNDSGPTVKLLLLYSELLVQNTMGNSIRNSMAMDKAFYKFNDGDFSRCITGRKGKSMFSVYIHGQNECLLQSVPSVVLSMKDLIQCSQPATRSLAVTLRNGAISGAPCWSLLLADLPCNISCSQSALVSRGPYI